MHIGHHITKRGMTLVELLIAVGLVTVVFGALLGSFHFMTTLIGSSKAQAGALALANGQLEYIRSLPYDDVGTISGIPDGLIPQISTTSLNGVEYTQRVLIQYVDAPQDGEGSDDENGILADYKLAKVEYTWDFKGEPQTISLITNIIPRGIETTAGGGTIRVNVFDAAVLPVSGAAVRVYNNTGTTTIDTTRYTNSEGVVLFSGAPALSDYEIFVSKEAFSSDQTYTVSSTNPYPTTLPVAVLESEVSTMNFQIDELSDLTVETIGLPTVGTFTDSFDDATQIASANNTTVTAGGVTLVGAPGSYASAGTVFSVPVQPGVFDTWDTVVFDAEVPSDTSALVYVYDTSASSTPQLISDTDLPGNSVGFTPGFVDISGLDPSTYSSLTLGAALTSSDTATTSALLEWNVMYTQSRPSITNVPFTLTGSRSIGTDASSTPVFKFVDSFVTDGSGEVMISDLEWDMYEVMVDDSSYDIAEACENIPYVLEPGVDTTLTLTLVPSVAQSLRVVVQDSSGVFIPNADVQLSRSGFSDSIATSACGQVFFSTGVVSASDYLLEVTAPGYANQTISEVNIAGSDTLVVTLIST